MSKVYVNEQELKEIFGLEFEEMREFFGEWLETKIEKGEIERVEFDHYEISN